MRRNVDVPKHSKKRARSKIDPISINMYEVFANGRGRAERGGRGFVLFLPSSPFPPSTPNCGRSRNALGNCRNCLGTRGRTDSSGSTLRWNGAGGGSRGRILHIERTRQTRFNCDPLYNYVMVASVSIAGSHNEIAYMPDRGFRHITCQI